MKKTLHIAGCDKFIPPFIDFVKENFDFNEHYFILTGGMAQDELKRDPSVILFKRTIIGRLRYYFQAIIKMHQAKKIILHGLFDFKLVIILFFMPWLLKKCYWVMWGGDLYAYQLGERNFKWKLREYFRHHVIRKIEYLVTYIKGDYELAQKWYGAVGQYQECLMYTSNLYKSYKVEERHHSGVNILIGNSADPTNNHLEILENLEVYKDQDITIYAPLSYGDPVYAKWVIEEGEKRFGDRFIPLVKMMPLEDYLDFLAEIDIAIFNHKRQQAMGNTITLLGLGKKVYMRSDVTQWKFFRDHDIEVFDVRNIDLVAMEDNKIRCNREYIEMYFSVENYRKQLFDIFN